MKILTITDEVDRKLVVELSRNTRINLSSIARRVGLSYATIRNRLLKLLNNNLLDIKPVVSPRLAGNVGGVLRIKSRNPNKILLKLSKCNKVIGALMINHEEILLLLYSRSKEELTYTIDRIVSMDDGIIEFSIEYGRIPSDVKILIRNPVPECNKCPYYKMGLCNGCLPILRIRRNKKKQ